MEPAKSLVLCDCRNADRPPDRFWPCDRKLHEADCCFHQETCEIDCVLDWHGFNKKEFKKFGRKLCAQLSRLFPLPGTPAPPQHKTGNAQQCRRHKGLMRHTAAS